MMHISPRKNALAKVIVFFKKSGQNESPTNPLVGLGDLSPVLQLLIYADILILDYLGNSNVGQFPWQRSFTSNFKPILMSFNEI